MSQVSDLIQQDVCSKYWQRLVIFWSTKLKLYKSLC